MPQAKDMGVEILQNPDISVEAHRVLVENAKRDLLIKNNLKAILALSGGADDKSPESKEQVVETIKDLILHIKDLPIAILTGGTNSGVPEIGMRVARESSLPTIGVFPERGRKYALLDNLDLAIETLPPSAGSPSFGTESSSFVNLSDGITIIGGSYGTLAEVAVALKVNAGRLRNGERPIYICPIQGTGGVADIAHSVVSSLPDGAETGAFMPNHAVTSGIEAANFFRANLEKTY